MLLSGLSGICLGGMLETLTLSQYWLCGIVAIVYGYVAVVVAGQLNVTFGPPVLPKDLLCVSFLLGVIASLAFVVALPCFDPNNSAVWLPLGLLLVLFGCGIIFNVGGVCLAPMVLFYYVISIPQLGMSLGPSDSASNFVCAAWLTASVFLRHKRDRRLVTGYAFLKMSELMIGGYAATGDSMMCSVFCFSCLPFLYVLAVAARYQRVLPHSLRNCKFIRLDKLRGMQKLGMRIKRCQELPTDIFGNVNYAAELIIISHRWLNRFSCDVATDDHPNGFLLDAMLASLDAYYPKSLREACNVGLSGLWRSLTISGRDVVIFFDFGCLPQIGLESNGEQIPRTHDEAAIFCESLPDMGALYTVYPVLVIPEVTPDVYPYFASGWCFSEFMSSLLANNLGMLSAKTVEEYNTWLIGQGAVGQVDIIDEACSSTLTDGSIGKFIKIFDDELRDKKFSKETDREVVDGIVKGFALQRLLKDAIIEQNEEDVQQCLNQLRIENMLCVLQHPFDHKLNTALHIAAALPSFKITQDILKCGLNPHAVNLHGDTPYQWYMIPRCNAGANLCRNSDSNSYKLLSTKEEQVHRLLSASHRV